jgi:toxin-antitoxin system PIN domain toxin
VTSTVDANILLYATDRSSEQHTQAQGFVERWAGGPDLVYVFWPTLMAYLRIATHPGVFRHPLEPDVAAANLESLLSLSHVRTGSEDERFWETWRRSTEGVVVRGNLVPDAHLVALMRQHGVSEIWSRDRDFRKFEGIRVRDPFGRTSR